MAIPRRTSLLLTLTLAAAACSGDDGDSVAIDAPGGTDAAACTVPATTTSCTIGDDSPCTALCAGAYCHNFTQLATPVCTNNCTVGSNAECPTGWTCNNMGRCRPPDP